MYIILSLFCYSFDSYGWDDKVCIAEKICDAHVGIVLEVYNSTGFTKP